VVWVLDEIQYWMTLEHFQNGKFVLHPVVPFGRACSGLFPLALGSSNPLERPSGFWAEKVKGR
jgi:hypothetical protein